MAYVLGFFAADGSMYRNKRGGYFIDFAVTDFSIVQKIKQLICPKHKISISKKQENWSLVYRLQIGSKELFFQLERLGFTPHKSLTLVFPKIPTQYVSDFMRGYFDGDGSVWHGATNRYRKNPSFALFARFISGSKPFVTKLFAELKKHAGLAGGSIHFHSNAFRLQLSTIDALKLYKFIYQKNPKLYLERKKLIFDDFIKNHGSVV